MCRNTHAHAQRREVEAPCSRAHKAHEFVACLIFFLLMFSFLFVSLHISLPNTASFQRDANDFIVRVIMGLGGARVCDHTTLWRVWFI